MLCHPTAAQKKGHQELYLYRITAGVMPLTAIQEGDSDRDGRGEWERDGVKERRKEECEGGVREGGREGGKVSGHHCCTQNPSAGGF